MVIPSQAPLSEEGVETRWQAPALRGEGIVQLTNSKEAIKIVVRCITDWSKVQVLPGPPKSSEFADAKRSFDELREIETKRSKTFKKNASRMQMSENFL